MANVSSAVRSACVVLVSFARRGVALDDAYDAALILGAGDHHLLQKAAGWLMREAGKTDMPRLEQFLLRHGRTLGRTTISYAIERFPPATRRRLLVSTRRTLAGVPASRSTRQG